MCQANYLHNCVQHLFLYNTVIVIHRPTRGVVRVPSMICLIGPTNHLRAETTQSPSEHAATTATATGAWFSVWEQTGLSTGRQNTTVMNTIQSTAVPAIAYEKRQRWLDSVRAPNDQRVPRAAQSVSLHTTVTKKQVRVSASWWFPIEKGRGTCELENANAGLLSGRSRSWDRAATERYIIREFDVTVKVLVTNAHELGYIQSNLVLHHYLQKDMAPMIMD